MEFRHDSVCKYGDTLGFFPDEVYDQQLLIFLYFQSNGTSCHYTPCIDHVALHTAGLKRRYMCIEKIELKEHVYMLKLEALLQATRSLSCGFKLNRCASPTNCIITHINLRCDEHASLCVTTESLHPEHLVLDRHSPSNIVVMFSNHRHFKRNSIQRLQCMRVQKENIHEWQSQQTKASSGSSSAAPVALCDHSLDILFF